MGISLAAANKMCEVAIAKADELGHKDQRRRLRLGRPTDIFRPDGRGVLGQRLRVPGQGDGLHGVSAEPACS